MKIYKLTIFVFLSFTLAACSGGGGGGSSSGVSTNTNSNSNNIIVDDSSAPELIDTYVMSGSVNASLPESVDSSGEIAYSDNEFLLISNKNFYVRAHNEHNFSDTLNIAASGIIRQNNKNSVTVNINWGF